MLRTPVFLIILVAVFAVCIVAEGNDRDGDWRQYPYQASGSDIVFPHDEGGHGLFLGLEWWYVVIHAVGKTSGHQYSILVAHFNNRFRFFTIANGHNKTHLSGTSIGPMDIGQQHLDLTHTTKYGKDRLYTLKDSKGELAPFHYGIETHHDKMHLKASLKSLKKPLVVGGSGYVAVGSSGHSWYYSLTRLQVKGTLSFDGVNEEIEGLGWMDHQWGPFMISPVEFHKVFESYEWFCIQLNNGTDIMVSNIFDRHYRLPVSEAYGGVQISDEDGHSFNTVNKRFKRTAYWMDPESGHLMSMGWKLLVPEKNLQLELIPTMRNQMVNFPLNGAFWEGSLSVKGTQSGVPVHGRGYGELIHRYQIPKIKFIKLEGQYGNKDRIKLRWKVENPDEGNSLLFDLKMIKMGNVKIIASELSTHEFSVDLGQVLNNVENSLELKFHVDAYSVDKTILGRAISHKIKIVPKIR